MWTNHPDNDQVIEDLHQHGKFTIRIDYKLFTQHQVKN
jgi:hypothetical protein